MEIKFSFIQDFKTLKVVIIRILETKKKEEF